MQVDERYGYIICSCGEKFQALKEYSYVDEQGKVITYIDSDSEELERILQEHLKVCPNNR